MSRTKKSRATIEAQVQAERLLKDLASPDHTRARPAAERLRTTPEYQDRSVEDILATPDRIKRKDALHAVALEWGAASWYDLAEGAKKGTLARPVPSEAMQRFFGVEIRNVEGEAPATLDSAHASFIQAPSDVLADWFGEHPFDAGRYRRELERLRALLPGDTPIEALLQAEQKPLQRFAVKVYLPGDHDDLTTYEIEAASAEAAEEAAIRDAEAEFGWDRYEAAAEPLVPPPPREREIVGAKDEHEIPSSEGTWRVWQQGEGRHFASRASTGDLRGPFSSREEADRAVRENLPDDERASFRVEIYAPGIERPLGRYFYGERTWREAADTAESEARNQFGRGVFIREVIRLRDLALEPYVTAEARSDDRARVVEFNAAAWLADADDADILELASIGWKGNDAADQVALELEEEHAGLAALFEYARNADVGFEVVVSETDAIRWLQEHCPRLAEIVTRTFVCAGCTPKWEQPDVDQCDSCPGIYVPTGEAPRPALQAERWIVGPAGPWHLWPRPNGTWSTERVDGYERGPDFRDLEDARDAVLDLHVASWTRLIPRRR